MLNARLFGPFRMYTDAGDDVTPRSVKTRALVALLLTGADGSRGRRWLQDKLWSDRGSEQASGSLRQALFELRRVLGPEASVLTSDRLSVTLDLAQIRVLPREGVGQEFLEGIDVGDPEFEDWLVLERSSRESVPVRTEARPGSLLIGASQPPPLSVLLRGPGPTDSPARLTLETLVDVFVVILAEEALADVYLETHGATEDDAELVLDLVHHTESNILRARLICVHSGRHVWTGTLRLDANDTDSAMRIEIARLATEGAQAAVAEGLRRRGQASQDKTGIIRAVRNIFTFRPADLAEADRLLASLGDTYPSALGWRVFLKMVHRIESAIPEDADFAAEVEALVQQSLSRGQQNTMVLAAAAHACIKVLNRPEDALILAERALQINWANPFAIDALSDALLKRERFDEAHALATAAQRIGQSTPMSHFFDMGLCLSSVACGRYEEALSMARQAAALAPSFRPALRYGVLLNAALGLQEDAHRTLARLRSVEPDLVIDRLLDDPDYPVATFRASSIARGGALRELHDKP